MLREWVRVNVILWGTVGCEPRQGRSSEKGEERGLGCLGSESGLTYQEGFIVCLPPEQIKCESLQPLCLDLF